MRASALTLSLSIAPEWDAVERTRNVVMDFCHGVFAPEETESIGMVTAELLENAVKYSGEPMAPIHYSLAAGPAETVLRVTNRVADHASTERLIERLARQERSPSAEAAYLERMQEVCEAEAASGLGLARVAYEGGCTLCCEVERGEVHIEARFISPPP